MSAINAHASAVYAVRHPLRGDGIGSSMVSHSFESGGGKAVRGVRTRWPGNRRGGALAGGCPDCTASAGGVSGVAARGGVADAGWEIVSSSIARVNVLCISKVKCVSHAVMRGETSQRASANEPDFVPPLIYPFLARVPELRENHSKVIVELRDVPCQNVPN